MVEYIQNVSANIINSRQGGMGQGRVSGKGEGGEGIGIG